MSTETDLSTRFGLLANGASGQWSVDIDEALDGSACYLQLEGPSLYLALCLSELSVVASASRFLGHKTSEKELALGWFGAYSASLVWDNEDFERCFLVVGESPHSVLRVSLDADDVRMIREALSQAAEDLPS